MVQVRHARREDLPAMAETLALAFEDDPVWGQWMFANRPDRLAGMTSLFHILVEAGLRSGHLYTTSGLEAAAHWVPPDVALLDDAQSEVFGEAAAGVLGRADTDRVFGGMAVLRAVHPGDIPHFYLPTLGVRPASQGKGYGAMLLQRVLQTCDADGFPAYLESSNRRNDPLYERHGFRAIETVELPDGPLVVAMWRDPRPAE
jgi:GNAT superfamily N-acetyltransferase